MDSGMDNQIAVEASSLNPALLNERVAGVISTLSRATHLSLQASSLLVEGFFEGAKYGTSAGLGLSRRTLVAAITTARSMHSVMPRNDQGDEDGASASHSEQFLQVMDKYTNLGIYYVHTAFTLAELFALTGFQLTSTTISTSLHAADESVRIIDGLFGSTETSRALAAVVQLVRREMFEDDDYSLAQAGTLTALGGIVKALTVFSCLQVVTWHRSGRDLVGPVIHEADFIDGKVVEPMQPPVSSVPSVSGYGPSIRSIEGARGLKAIEGSKDGMSSRVADRPRDTLRSWQDGYGSNAKDLSRQLAILSVKERALRNGKEVSVKEGEEEGEMDVSEVDPELLWELESV
ncbi:hypothetical protein BJ684DRAFT_21260, partial [Piptocephalis cylindrospora]